MFYVKTQLNDDASLEVDITKKNVFCRCPFCGTEVPVNLDDFARDRDFSVYTSSVACTKCSRKAATGILR